MFRQSVFFAASAATAQLLIAFLYLVVARETGPSRYGDIVAAVALAGVVSGLIDFGTNSLWIRDIARGEMTVSRWSGLFFSKVIVAMAVAAGFAMVCSIFFNRTLYFYSGTICLGMVISQGLQVPLRGMAKGGLAAIATVVDRVACVATYFVLQIAHFSPISAIFVALFVGSISSGFAANRMTPRRNRFKANVVRLSIPWVGARSYGLGSVAVSAQGLDASILHALAGSTEVGIYGAVNRWTQPMGLLATAFASAGLPFVAREHSVRGAFRTVRKSSWILLVAVLACLLIALGAGPLSTILLGQAYRASSGVLTVLALATVPALLNQPLYVFLQALGHEVAVGRIVVAGVVLQLIACSLAAASMGAMGAALALALAQTAMCGALIFYAVSSSSVMAGRHYSHGH